MPFIPFFIAIIESAHSKGRLPKLLDRFKRLEEGYDFVSTCLGQIQSRAISMDTSIARLLHDSAACNTFIRIGQKVASTYEGRAIETAFARAFHCRLVIYPLYLYSSPRVYEYSSTHEASLEATLADSSAEDFALILYKTPKSLTAEKAKREIAEELLETKLVEAKLLEEIVNPQGDLRDARVEDLKLSVDRLESIRMAAKKPAEGWLQHELKVFLEEMGRVGPTRELYEKLMKKIPRIESSYIPACLKCYKIPNGVYTFACTHMICNDCFVQYLTEGYKKTAHLVWKCPLAGCNHVLTEAEQIRIDLRKEAFMDPNARNSGEKRCGMCTEQAMKVNGATLHGEHVICQRCLKGWVEQVTEGKVYVYVTRTGKVADYPCPVKGCNERFTYEVVGRLYSWEENAKLFQLARMRFATVG